jgi:hypothetical protein
MSTGLTIEHIIEERRRARPGATVRQVGEAALELEQLNGEVVLSWISSLTVRDFVSKLEATPDMIPSLSVSRPSHKHQKVSSSRITDQTPLSDDEASSIFLIRYDQGEYSLGFEPVDINRTTGFNLVSVLAPTKGAAIEHLEQFLPIDAVSVASSPSFTSEI